jgi:hypothetical protein
MAIMVLGVVSGCSSGTTTGVLTGAIQPCVGASRPIPFGAGIVRVFRNRLVGRLVARSYFKSNQFSFVLPPGRYVLTATSTGRVVTSTGASDYDYWPPAMVTVLIGRTGRVDIRGLCGAVPRP